MASQTLVRRCSRLRRRWRTPARICFANLSGLVDRLGRALDEAECVCEVIQLSLVEQVHELSDGHAVLEIEHLVRLHKLLAVVLELPTALQELLVGDCGLLGRLPGRLRILR